MHAGCGARWTSECGAPNVASTHLAPLSRLSTRSPLMGPFAGEEPGQFWYRSSSLDESESASSSQLSNTVM